jgi:hypothetical protein
MAPQRLRLAPQNFMGAWLHHSPMLALVHHRSNSTVPEFLQWWHIILLRTSFLGCGKTFSYNPSSFIFCFAGTRSPSSNQSSFPQEKVLSSTRKGKIHLGHFEASSLISTYVLGLLHVLNPREVPTKRCFGFVGIPGLKEIANMER